MSYDKENQALAFMSHNQDQGLMDLLTINSQDEAATTEDEHHITETESRTSQNTATSYMTTPLVTPIESMKQLNTTQQNISNFFATDSLTP